MSVVLEPTERERAPATKIERLDRTGALSRALGAVKRLIDRAAGFALALLRNALGR